MSTKSKYLRRLIQGNEHLVRLQKHIITAGVDYKHDLDSAFGAVEIFPHLLVPQLASLFAGPQGSVLHIPLHISERSGGRPSLFMLAPGQEIVVGIYVVGGKLFERRVTKQTGTADLLVGDEFTERITDMAGAKVQVHTYRVRAIGSLIGAIHLESTTAEEDIDTGDLVNTGDGWCWFCNGGSAWWCGFPCLPGEFEEDIFV
jgi:hypothetical protein